MERSGVRPSVSLSHRSTAAAAAGGFAAQRRRLPQIGLSNRSVDAGAGAQLQMRASSLAFSCDGPN